MQALERAGCLVYQMDRPCDLLVQRAGTVHLLEVKNPAEVRPSHKNEKTEGQRRFMAQGWAVHIVYSPSDALAAVGLLKA